jgi:hypothetical protein
MKPLTFLKKRKRSFVMFTIFAYLCVVAWRASGPNSLTVMVLLVGTGILLAMFYYRPKVEQEVERENSKPPPNKESRD